MGRPLRIPAVWSSLCNHGDLKPLNIRPVDARLEFAAWRMLVLFEGILAVLLRGPSVWASCAGLATVLRQEVSVDTLEHIVAWENRQRRSSTGFPPPARRKGDLLHSFTADEVPAGQEDAQRVPTFEKSERPGNRRMATLACVYTIDRYVRTPEQIIGGVVSATIPDRGRSRPQPGSNTSRHSLPGYARSRTGSCGNTTARWKPFVRQSRPLIRASMTKVPAMDGQARQWNALRIRVWKCRRKRSSTSGYPARIQLRLAGGKGV